MTIASSSARAIADLDAGTVLATVDIAVPPERVFRALTTDEIVRWWGSDDLYRTTAYTADLRVGGRWRADGKGADGAPFFVEGEFLEIDPPRTLVQTWRPAWEPDAPTTTIRYRLDPIDGGTRVTLRHTGFADRRDSCGGHASGWQRVLGWLGRHLAGARAAQYYVVRLIPPRPTFAQDMNDAERAMMAEHAAYWRGHLDRGAAIVYGPVADPAGGWGLAVVRAADEAELRDMQAKDPAIRSDYGFRYEILPMLRAIHRES
jgi:uncharacterized protein YndB with AHSA1/START domain